MGTFGFTHDEKNFITAILDGDLAPINFEMSIGDKIHSVNEVPVTPYNDIDNMLQNSGSQVRLKVQRNKQLQGNILLSKNSCLIFQNKLGKISRSKKIGLRTRSKICAANIFLRGNTAHR